MPIRGVSEIVRLPRLGKIHLGIMVEYQTGKFRPSATDYFVCPEEVQGVFGKEPKELRVMFPIDDDQMVAQQWYRAYSQTRGLICRGDGETSTQLTDLKTGAIATKDSPKTEMREGMTCAGEQCDIYQTKRCRRVMNLQFMLPDVPGLGVWQLDTGSFFSIVNINSNLKLIRGICGRISMIPLVLSLGPREVAPDGKKKIVHILNLTAPFSLTQLQERAQLPPGRAMLPAPDTSRPDLLFADAEEEALARVVDSEQARRDIDELFDKPQAPTPPVSADPPPEPQATGSSEQIEGDTEGEAQMRDLIREKVEAQNWRQGTVPSWCAQWGADSIDEIPRDKLEAALAWFKGK